MTWTISDPDTTVWNLNRNDKTITNVLGSLVLSTFAVTVSVDADTKPSFQALTISESPTTITVSNSDTTVSANFDSLATQTFAVSISSATRRMTLTDITDNYQGSFKSPVGAYGECTIAVKADGSSMFIGGAAQEGIKIHEISIPTLLTAANPNSLNTASEIQSGFDIHPNIPATNWDTYYNDFDASDDGILWGMYHTGSKLFANCYIYYDNTEDPGVCVLIDNPASISTSTIQGDFTVNGKHKSLRWISDIPAAIQPDFGGATHLCGAGSGVPILSRCSLGPSLSTLDISDFDGAATNSQITVTNKMIFDGVWIDGVEPLNYTGALGGANNTTYTALSEPVYGFIVPNTRCYLVIGWSAGHRTNPLNFTTATVDGYVPLVAGLPCTNPYVGTKTDFDSRNGTIFYKAASWADDLGRVADGYSAYDKDSVRPYYWLFDIDDIIGAASVTDPVPYETGEFPIPYATTTYTDPNAKADVISGATFDATNGILYIALPTVNNTSDEEFNGNPVIAAYDLSSISL